jgi:hypothetical protein
MSDKIYDFEVTDRQSFVRFLELLHEDCLRDGKNWENNTLPDFLEAMSRYTEDIQGYYDNTKQDIDANKADWKIFADILLGAKIYE